MRPLTQRKKKGVLPIGGPEAGLGDTGRKYATHIWETQRLAGELSKWISIFWGGPEEEFQGVDRCVRRKSRPLRLKRAGERKVVPDEMSVQRERHMWGWSEAWGQAGLGRPGHRLHDLSAWRTKQNSLSREVRPWSAAEDLTAIDKVWVCPAAPRSLRWSVQRESGCTNILCWYIRHNL